MKKLFTIGHSNHTLEHFLELLAKYQISAIADVRSSPYSQYLPHFNKELLENALRNANVDYVFLGGELGARRSENSCYVDSQAKYERIAQLPVFRHGIERVLEGIEHYILALMCSEADPITCHRTILVCRELKKVCPDLEIIHILGDGTTESQESSDKRLVNFHKLQPELFGDLTSMSALIEKAYDLQSEKIAYKKELIEA